MIETVKDLIDALGKFNPEAKVYAGDNLYNRISLSYGGCDGCGKEDCSDVGIHIEGKCESSWERTAAGMAYNNVKIVITDPCYLKTSKPDIERGTLCGDWSCMVYPGEMDKNKDPEIWEETYYRFSKAMEREHIDGEELQCMENDLAIQSLRNDLAAARKDWIKNHTLGTFSADAGGVGVFQYGGLSKTDREWIESHPRCAAVIPNVTGVVKFVVRNKGGMNHLHVVCEGETPFFSVE